MAPASFALCFLFSGLVAAQVPSSWKAPKMTTSVVDRINTAKGAIDEALAQLDSTSGQFADPNNTYPAAGTLFAQMAEFDLATNQSVYLDTLLNLWPVAEATSIGLGNINFTGDYIIDGLGYGYAGIIGYRAYNNPAFLKYAQQSWWAANAYTSSSTDLETGTPLKNFTLASTCNGNSMAGGTFYLQDASNDVYNAWTTGLYVVLSAWLAEIVLDPMYLAAATQSLAFLQAHLYSSSQNLVLDTIGAKAGSSCTAASTLYPKNTGLLLEALSVLNSITENSTTVEWAEQILSAVFSTTAWQGVDGILRPANLVISNGLQVAYTKHLSSNSSTIAAYLTVQFNAITTLARTNNSNIYGTLGNPATTFNLNDQIQAIGSLIAAINIETNSSTISTSGSTEPDSATTTDSPDHSKNRWHIIAIAVSVLGAVAILGAVLALVLISRWQHRKHQQHLSLCAPDPFTAPEISVSMQMLSPKARLKSILLSQQGQVSYSHDTRFKPEVQRPLDATSEALSLVPQQEVAAPVLQPEIPVEILPSGSQNIAGESEHCRPNIMTDELLQLLLERMNQSPHSIQLGVDYEEPPQYTG